MLETFLGGAEVRIMETNLEKRQQTLLVLWCAQLMSVVLLFLVAFLAAPEITNDAGSANNVLTFVFAALASFLVVISFVVKRKLLERSVDQQDVTLVQKALIVAWALCEVGALLGVVERFVIGNRDYFLLFIIAALGMALHFPRGEYLKSASFKTPLSGGGAGS
jgi:uncharacterized membrane protein YhaH (DUF805 family)